MEHNMKIEKNIQLSTVEVVKDFVNAISVFECEVDLRSERYCVNGKSIMGIFSLDLSRPIKLEADVDDKTQADFLKAVEPYCI